MLSMVKKKHITASRQDTNLHNVDTRLAKNAFKNNKPWTLIPCNYVKLSNYIWVDENGGLCIKMTTVVNANIFLKSSKFNLKVAF